MCSSEMTFHHAHAYGITLRTKQKYERNFFFFWIWPSDASMFSIDLVLYNSVIAHHIKQYDSLRSLTERFPEMIRRRRKRIGARLANSSHTIKCSKIDVNDTTSSVVLSSLASSPWWCVLLFRCFFFFRLYSRCKASKPIQMEITAKTIFLSGMLIPSRSTAAAFSASGSECNNDGANHNWVQRQYRHVKFNITTSHLRIAKTSSHTRLHHSRTYTELSDKLYSYIGL